MTRSYEHQHEAVQRPDVGVQNQFATKKPAKLYSYDSSLDPALSWDENRERDLSEWLIALIGRSAQEGEAETFASPQVWRGGGVQVQSLKATADLLQNLTSEERRLESPIPEGARLYNPGDAWDNLKKSLKADFDESVWSHLAGTASEPFVPGPRRHIAVKVIDERGNELMRVLEVN